MPKQYANSASAGNASTAATPRQGAVKLSTRDSQVFRNMMKSYDNKQYRKAVKLGDIILKTNPNHGETIAMRGLSLYNLPGKKDEAFSSCKQALKVDIGNYMCWHVLGILHRHERNYDEALRCYTHACRLEANNIALLRDLSFLQIYQGMNEAFLDTRRKLLTLRPSIRGHWWQVSLGYHLCGDYDMACGVLKSIEDHLLPTPTTTNKDNDKNEINELCLYRALILEESGNYEGCLAYLSERDEKVSNRIKLLQTNIRLMIYLRRLDEAHHCCKQLAGLMPENEDVVSLCLATAHPCQRLFVFPEPPHKMAHQLGNRYPPPSAAFEINPSALLAHGSRRTGWPVPTAQQWMTSPLNVGLRKQRILLDRFQQQRAQSHQSNNGSVAPQNAMEGVCENCDTPLLSECNGIHTHDLGWERPLHRNSPYCQKKSRKKSLELCSFRPLRVLSEEEEILLMEQWKYIRECSSSSRIWLSLPLRWLSGRRLRDHIDLVLRPLLNKFVTATFELLKPCYYSANNVDIVSDLLHSYTEEQTTKTKKLQSEFYENGQWNESPMFQGAVQMLLAQHYGHINQTEKALRYIEEAIAHTPTLVELLLIKASLLKHRGDDVRASVTLEEARTLDLADRYLNLRSSKGLLRINEIAEADKVSQVFAKQSTADGRNDVQCLWYDLAVASAYRRLNDWDGSLTKYRRVFAYFKDFKEDVFDFNAYCLRRLSYTSYVAFLRNKRILEAHKNFRIAAHNSVRLYYKLADLNTSRKPLVTQNGGAEMVGQIKTEPVATGNGTTKQVDMGAVLSISGRNVPSCVDPYGQRRSSKVTNLPNGEQNWLVEASHIVDTLRTSSSLDSKTHKLSYDLFSRTEGIEDALVMLQSLVALWLHAGGTIMDAAVAPRLTHFLAYLIQCPALRSSAQSEASNSSKVDMPSTAVMYQWCIEISSHTAEPVESWKNQQNVAAIEVIDVVINVIVEHLCVMFRRQFQLYHADRSATAALMVTDPLEPSQAVPSVKLSRQELQDVMSEYLLRIVTTFTQTADAERILAACIAMEMGGGDELLFKNVLKPSLLNLPSIAITSIRECRKMTEWLRGRAAAEADSSSPKKIMFTGGMAQGVSMEQWVEVLLEFEKSCARRFPSSPYWRQQHEK